MPKACVISKPFLEEQKAMTLIELLIVMGIIMALMTLGISGFVSLRRSQQLEQSSAIIYSEIRNTQRSSLLYHRKLGENWVWGMILKFNNFDGEDTIASTSSKIEIYKYCASSIGGIEYQAYPAVADDYLPISNIKQDCSGAENSLVKDSDIEVGAGFNYLTASLSTNQPVKYLVFETISGEIHYYDTQGLPLPTDSNFEIVLGNGGPTQRLLRIISDTSRFSLNSVSSNYKTGEK